MKKSYSIRHLNIDFNDYKIESNGVELDTGLKAVEVLEILVNNDGNTVSIDTFMDEVWKDKPSSPEVVTAAIARLRKLFKMTGVGDDLIVTVHKVGYRFEHPSDESIQKNTKIKSNKRLPLFIAASILFASIAFNIYNYFQPNKKLDLGSGVVESINQESKSKVTQIYILRHAEKSDTINNNPPLSQVGENHAGYWKKVLQHVKFDRVFTTDFARNIKTADILSEGLGLEPEIYYPMSFEVLKFIHNIQGQKVLVIGHSNTIPDMVNRLIDENKYPPMSHKNYNLMFVITINKNGDTSSSLMHIEMP